MNAIRPPFSSARRNRMLLWFSVAVLASGAIVLAFKLVGGSDPTNVGPDKGFKASLPAETHDLVDTHGVKLTKYSQLDPEIKAAMRHFIVGAVAGKDYGDSWKYIVGDMKSGYTYGRWVHDDGHPIVPYPLHKYAETQFHLVQANNEEILVEVGLTAAPKAQVRPEVFLIGLAPVGTGTHKRWLVDYWGTRWTPPISIN